MIRKVGYLFIVAGLLSPLLAFSFGISPPNVSVDKLVKGSRYEATIFLVRQNAESDLGIEAVFNVPEKIKNWVTLETGNSFIIPVGVQQFPVKVRIEVPPDADLGIYNGSITFNTSPVRQEGQEGQQVVIAVGANLSLNLTVGEGVFVDFKIKNIDILDIKEGEPLQIIVTLENTGNVAVAPQRATFDLLDKYGQVRLGFGQSETLPETPAFETKTFTVEFPIDIKLGVGEYWGETKLYRDNIVVAQTKTVFNVVKKKINWLLWLGIIIGGLIIGGAFRLFIKKKTRKEIPVVPQAKPIESIVPTPTLPKKTTSRKKTKRKEG